MVDISNTLAGKIARRLAAFDKYEWQLYPTLAQGRKQTRYELRAVELVGLVHEHEKIHERTAIHTDHGNQRTMVHCTCGWCSKPWFLVEAALAEHKEHQKEAYLK